MRHESLQKELLQGKVNGNREREEDPELVRVITSKMDGNKLCRTQEDGTK